MGALAIRRVLNQRAPPALAWHLVTGRLLDVSSPDLISVSHGRRRLETLNDTFEIVAGLPTNGVEVKSFPPAAV